MEIAYIIIGLIIVQLVLSCVMVCNIIDLQALVKSSAYGNISNSNKELDKVRFEIMLDNINRIQQEQIRSKHRGIS